MVDVCSTSFTSSYTFSMMAKYSQSAFWMSAAHQGTTLEHSYSYVSAQRLE